jgi:hypothetical protein
MASWNRFACSGFVYMKTFETTDPKVARRCRYDQHRGQKTSLTVEGWLVTGLGLSDPANQPRHGAALRRPNLELSGPGTHLS